MVMTFESLNLGEIDSGVVIGSVQKASAFQRVGRRIALPRTGAVVTKVSGITAAGVGEGEEKIASGSLAGVPVGSNKIHSTVVQTEEAFSYSETIASVVFDEQPAAVAKQFDAYVSGIVPLPANWANFSTFASATEVEIGTGADASQDFDDALAALSEGVYTGLVASTAFLNYLKRQRNAANGLRVFEVSGDTNEGVFEGLNFATFVSNIPVAFIGNFDNYVWGADEFLGGDNNSPYRVHTSGMQQDSNAVVHNLNAENKVAIQYEQFVGSGIADLASFVKLVPAA